MARKEEAPNMVERFAEFKELKNIDKSTMVSVLEESFRSVLAKMFGTDENLDVIMNPDKGDVQIFQNLEVVEDGTVTNPNLEISLSDARADGDPDAEVGEEHTKEIVFANFGRRAILQLRQTLQSRIMDLQKEAIIAKFKEMEGELVNCEVYQAWSKETILYDDEKNELVLPRSATMPGEFFRKGEFVLAVIQSVDNKNSNPKITVSRTSTLFLKRLFEREVPEVHDGLISIKGVARIAGQGSKVAVESYDDRIDPVGACIGMNGARIKGVVRELRNENIDVIAYTPNTRLFIQRALNLNHDPQMRLDEEEKRAEVFLAPDEVARVIGRGGTNIKLASMLTGYVIDIYHIDQADEEDIYLDEFRDEIEGWMVDELKKKGYITAKNVLNAPKAELLERTELEQEMIDDICNVLQAEFEDEPEDSEPAQAAEDTDQPTPEPETDPDNEDEPTEATEA